jgi:UDP-glucuronate 4-epimerase
MSVVVTGAAGFIGFHVARYLLEQGESVIGIDNINDYYSVSLKEARLAQLRQHREFHFYRAGVDNEAEILEVFARHPDISVVIHLAAQAGVRYSLQNPYAYIDANVRGHTVMSEAARRSNRVRCFVYASSSSVYGGNTKQPFSVRDPVDNPVSLYAATKRSCELIAQTYAHLYRLPCIGLRFFTVYGPWGRPDMAAYLFTDAIMNGRPIDVFAHGKMARDFTYIDDIVAGVLAAANQRSSSSDGSPPHRIYNLGNNRAEKLLDFIGVIERLLGRTAEKRFLPLQPGDVPESLADISESQRDLGFEPKTPISVGLPRFIEWYKAYHGGLA